MADVETAVPEEMECQEEMTGAPVITHAAVHRKNSDYMVDHSDPMLETAMPDEMDFAQVLAGEKEEAQETVEIPVDDIPVGDKNLPEPEESNILTLTSYLQKRWTWCRLEKYYIDRRRALRAMEVEQQKNEKLVTAHVTPRESTGPLTNAVLRWLGHLICGSWEEVARAADVSRAKVSKLRRQYQDDRDEAAFQMLVHWRSSQAKGNDAFRELATALESCGFNSVAKVLLRRKESGLLLRSPSTIEAACGDQSAPMEAITDNH